MPAVTIPDVRFIVGDVLVPATVNVLEVMLFTYVPDGCLLLNVFQSVLVK